MRSFFCKAILIALVLNFGCKKNTTIYISDKEGIFTDYQVFQLDSLFKSHEKKTSNEIALITTPDFAGDSSILNFAQQFGRHHGIGKKDKNNGIVIAFSRTKKAVNISTGLGTDKVLKDELAKKIIDDIMIPRFKEGKEFEGIYNGSKAIVAFLELPENNIK